MKKMKKDKMTFIGAAIEVLSKNGNIPMSSKEIWGEIEERELVITNGKTPRATLNSNLLVNSINTSLKSKRHKNQKIFKISSNDPNRYILVDYQEKMTFIEGAIKILEENKNIPLSAREIWNEIEEKSLVETSGKTPIASLNKILLTNSINTTLKSNQGNNNKLFKIVSRRPLKYILVDHQEKTKKIPDHITELLTRGGFITKDILLDILSEYDIKKKSDK